MNYIYKLKFQNQQEAEAFLSKELDYMASVETIVTIGIIYSQEVIDNEGIEITPAEPVDGWHVDVLAHEMIAELKPYCLDHIPSSPVHGYGWAGDNYEIVLKN